METRATFGQTIALRGAALARACVVKKRELMAYRLALLSLACLISVLVFEKQCSTDQACMLAKRRSALATPMRGMMW